MKVVFKNVGQGDTIILEWNSNEGKKIALIDCNLHDGNPAISYIKKFDIRHIEYIILTHPHYDHFSGLRELLEYCIANDVKLKYFLHSAEIVPEYLSAANLSIETTKELAQLYRLVQKLRDDDIIEKVGTVGDFPELVLPIDGKFSMKFLSPGSKEKDNYIKNVNTFDDCEDGNNNNKANWLSIVTKIFSEDQIILLTSDAEKQTLRRITKTLREEFKYPILVAQCPHHGSGGNHDISFWRSKPRAKDAEIVFSVGRNSYGHPSTNVIEDFKSLGFNIRSTNKIGGLEGVLSEKVFEIESMLDLSSEEVIDSSTSNQFQGDQEFLF